MLTLVGTLRSRTFRVAWMLEELGLEYEHVAAPPRSDEAIAADPGGKVPILMTEEGPIRDSVAIMTWLADRHGRFTHPAGSYARAQQDAATCQVLDDIEALLWAAARHSFILPQEHRVPAVKESLKWEFSRNMKRLAGRVGRDPYLAGDAPTVPDFLLTHCLNWAANAKFEAHEPVLEDLADRMRARPAYAKVMALRG